MDQSQPNLTPNSPNQVFDSQPIANALQLLAGAIAESKVAPPAESSTLLDDYKVTVDMIKLFTDIRFRCLVFVTSITAIAIALLPGTVDSATRIAIGLVGLLATLGIAVYELRNSQLYEAASHRAKELERLLGMVSTTENVKKQGLFGERPKYVKDIKTNEDVNEMLADCRKSMPFLLVEVKHDRGLALIYGAVLGGWVFLVADGLLSLPPRWHPPL